MLHSRQLLYFWGIFIVGIKGHPVQRHQDLESQHDLEDFMKYEMPSRDRFKDEEWDQDIVDAEAMAVKDAIEKRHSHEEKLEQFHPKERNKIDHLLENNQNQEERDDKPEGMRVETGEDNEESEKDQEEKKEESDDDGKEKDKKDTASEGDDNEEVEGGDKEEKVEEASVTDGEDDEDKGADASDEIKEDNEDSGNKVEGNNPSDKVEDANDDEDVERKEEDGEEEAVPDDTKEIDSSPKEDEKDNENEDLENLAKNEGQSRETERETTMISEYEDLEEANEENLENTPENSEIFTTPIDLKENEEEDILTEASQDNSDTTSMPLHTIPADDLTTNNLPTVAESVFDFMEDLHNKTLSLMGPIRDQLKQAQMLGKRAFNISSQLKNHQKKEEKQLLTKIERENKDKLLLAFDDNNDFIVFGGVLSGNGSFGELISSNGSQPCLPGGSTPPPDLVGAAHAIHEGHLVICGGMRLSLKVPLANCYKLKLDGHSQWEIDHALPEPRAFAAAHSRARPHEMWITGGIGKVGKSSVIRSSVGDVWHPGPYLPTFMSHHCMAEITHHPARGIFVFGGLTKGISNNAPMAATPNTWSFHGQIQRWRQERDMDEARLGHACAVNEPINDHDFNSGKILVSGGINVQGETLETMEEFDTSTKTWRTRQKLKKGLSHLMMTYVGRNLVAAGGVTHITMDKTTGQPEFKPGKQEPREVQVLYKGKWSITNLKLQDPRVAAIMIPVKGPHPFNARKVCKEDNQMEKESDRLHRERLSELSRMKQ